VGIVHRYLGPDLNDGTEIRTKRIVRVSEGLYMSRRPPLDVIAKRCREKDKRLSSRL